MFNNNNSNCSNFNNSIFYYKQCLISIWNLASLPVGIDLPLNSRRSPTDLFIFSIRTSIFNYLCLKLTNSYYFRTMFMPELKLRIYV